MKNLRLFPAFALFVMLASLARALTVIYPVDAIQDLWNLAAEDFRQKYSGINISGLGPSDEGWYVRYRHENLTYLFGPLPDREEARKKKWEMETVRDAAIRNRPTLQSSEVDFVRFTFSGAFGKGSNSPYGGGGGPRISKDGRSGPDGDLDGDGIPNYLDDDMDGDGIPNAQDDDIDGDGIPNAKDDYMYGKNPALEGTGADGLAKDGSEGGDGRGGGAGEGADGGSGKGGKGGKRGKGGQGGADGGDVRGETLAGLDGSGGDGNQGGSGGKSGGRSGRSGGQGGAGGSDGADGDDSGSVGQQGSRGQGGRQVASNQRGAGGAQGGQAGGQQGGGQQGGQQGGGQQGGGGSAGGQSGGQGQPGGGSPGAAGSSGGGGNPLDLVVGLLRAILGI